MAKNSDWMQAAWKERGQKPPVHFQEVIEEEGLDDQPELDYLEMGYLRIYNAAATCRPSAYGGVLPLPYTVIAEVLDRHLYGGSEFETAMQVVRAMDEVVLDHYAEMRK
jgi:hypothetical protein